MATKKRTDQGTGKAGRKDASKGERGRPAQTESAGAGGSAGLRRVEETPMPIVAIGSSAGGLEALQELFSNVPADSGIAFVVVTHLRSGRPSLLPELLGSVTKMEVFHAGDKTKIEPNKVIVARDSLMSVSRGVLRPVQIDDKVDTAYHPIDHFFRSLADDQREHAIGVILSGSGNDGALGLKAIKAAGGMVMAQSPGTAKYASMPESAIATHLVDYVLAPRAMPQALIEYCRGPYLQLIRRANEPPLPEDTIQAILARLRAHSGQDFTCYKKSTMSRRIQRRMNVHHIDDPQEYLGFLRENSYEIEALMEELLISVTSFFRDPAAWRALADDALSRLIAERPDGYGFRVWVAGCATGEEAYSVAILFQEQIRQTERTHPVQIFATDLDERAIDVARAGLYPEGISADVSPERLKTFFAREDGAYRIHKSIRDSIVFAGQNVISDPPFTRLDLIVCRNVLIYLDATAQQTVLPNFHYALLPGGMLFLGSAESVGESGALFDIVNARHRILRRKEVAKPVHPVLLGAGRRPPGDARLEDRSPRVQQQFNRRVEQFLVEKFVPCSILVDDRGSVAHIQGRAGLYLEPEQGSPRNNILEMAREGLGPALAIGMRQARQEEREIVRSGIRVRTNGGYTDVDLSVLPVHEPEPLKGLLLLTIRPSASASTETRQKESPAPAGADNLELERELQRVRESLQITVEELETSNEELKSSNEELQSTNEELQSTNEELETSKEEMQSLNEELNTVNAELSAKVEALARTNDDMNNLLNSMQVGAIFLDTKLRVKRYTEQARDVVRLIASDIGRPLSDLTSSLRYEALLQDCERVLTTLIPVENEVSDASGRWYLVRLMPYRTAENVIAGVVMTVVEIDRVKKAEEQLRQSLETTRERESVMSAMIEHIPMGIIIADAPDVAIRAVSRFGRELIGQSGSEVMGRGAHTQAQRMKVYKADGVTLAKAEELPLTRATKSGEIIREEVWIVVRPDGVRIPILCAAGPIRDADGRITGGVMGWQDITERRRIEEDLRQSDEKYSHLFESMDEGFCTIEVLFDERDNPVDYRFLEVNPSFARQTGLASARGKTMRDVSPDHDASLLEMYAQVARTGQARSVESLDVRSQRRYRVYAWSYGRPQDRHVAVLFNDITAPRGVDLRAGSGPEAPG